MSLTVVAPFTVGPMSGEKKEIFTRIYITFCRALESLMEEGIIQKNRFISKLFIRDKLLTILSLYQNQTKLHLNSNNQAKLPLHEETFQIISARCHLMLLEEEKRLAEVKKLMREDVFASWPVELIELICGYQKEVYWK